MSIITLETVSKTYNPGRPNEFVALHEISVEIASGQCAILAGPSGSGKTTLLSLMGLMSRPSSGRIAILDRETTLLAENFRTLFRRRHIGFIFQHFQLIADLTVNDNLDLVLYPEGTSFDTIRERRTSLLERFGLISKGAEKTSILSGGEQQRLAIARALMNNPEILLVDEPTAHLDTALSEHVIALFRDLKKDGKTLVITSHDPLVLASGLAEKVIHLRDGRIIKQV
ncbi:ABC transporter ATP-binding protein [Desulfomonile tiedjei]|uniref:ABC-type antimicrobial peptide transport system, ATPase component n=1 Tax=Desulfomonile tiedjei (strain ATCC 49306 / DSM 6799 / DCB-1) TaxID=706587 RepID=I4C1F5_DESTA|nr:ABC transporter ATP-binding protein [Desulfomonile tiedjei]AFM23396.1 ABC-type antimicrobial peptide transport system, ATPase component [Desulfomonile tiedjei DSM 6799]